MGLVDLHEFDGVVPLHALQRTKEGKHTVSFSIAHARDEYEHTTRAIATRIYELAEKAEITAPGLPNIAGVLTWERRGNLKVCTGAVLGNRQRARPRSGPPWGS